MEDAGHPLLDTEKSQQKIWLLSVPNYLGELWSKPEYRNKLVGQIKLEKVQKLGKIDNKVTYILDENLSVSLEAPPDAKKPRIQPAGGFSSLNMMKKAGALSKNQPAITKIPREHEFTFQAANNQQLLGVISKTKNLEHTEVRKLEGYVANRAQLKPPRNSIYNKFKAQRTVKTNTPKMVVQTITTREATNARKDYGKEMEYSRASKEDRDLGKVQRLPKEELMEKVLDLFGKHSYYHINDLTKITCHTQKAVKEVLDEIGVQIKEGDHKYKWKLNSDYN